MTTASCQRPAMNPPATTARVVGLPFLEGPQSNENPLAPLSGPRSLAAVQMLRISVTDVCNLRCVYCMPEEGVEWLGKSNILSFEEIAAIARVAARAGITHFKLTGGEPTARRDLPLLVKMLRGIDGVKDLSLTTNGILLAPLLPKLKEAGLDRITISIDSLRPERFAQITRGGDLTRVWNAIDSALTHNFQSVKLNVVAMRGINDDEVAAFAALTQRLPVTVRFIEFMPLGRSGLTDNPAEAMITETEIRAAIEHAHGPLQPVRRNDEPGVGPAKVWRLNGAPGKLGFISAMSHPFCDTCNRLRLTPDGLLRSCLFDGGEVDLKQILRKDAENPFQNPPPPPNIGDYSGSNVAPSGNLRSLEEQLLQAFATCVVMKPQTHSAHGNKAMNRIGG